MKKLVTAIVIASIGAAFAANSVVYDYKASIKRLDLSMKAGKVAKNTTAILQKFSVKSDTIQGFVTLPLCYSCDGPVEKSHIELDYNRGEFGKVDLNPADYVLPSRLAYAYLTLKGDKYSKVISRPEYLMYPYTMPGKKNVLVEPKTDKYLYVLKTPANARAAMFGADQNVQTTLPVNNAQNTKAWLALDFYMPALKKVGASNYANGEAVYSALEDVEAVGRLLKAKGYAPEPNGLSLLYLGFLGLSNDGFGTEDTELIDVPTMIQNAGFGTLKKITNAPVAGICTNGTPGSECNIINTISGSLVGYPNYQGICQATPMWDFCYFDPMEQVHDAVISGTWSLKFNKAMTEKFATQGDDAILAKFKVSAKYLYKIDEAGYVVSPSEIEVPLGFHKEDEASSSSEQ